MPTIATELETVEKQISQCEKNLDKIEKSIRLGSLTVEERQTLKAEEATLKKEIVLHDKKVKELRKENRKSAVVSFILLGLVYLVYRYLVTS